jgi:hypothetical protein
MAEEEKVDTTATAPDDTKVEEAPQEAVEEKE